MTAHQIAIDCRGLPSISAEGITVSSHFHVPEHCASLRISCTTLRISAFLRQSPPFSAFLRLSHGSIIGSSSRNRASARINQSKSFEHFAVRPGTCEAPAGSWPGRECLGGNSLDGRQPRTPDSIVCVLPDRFDIQDAPDSPFGRTEARSRSRTMLSLGLLIWSWLPLW
jgi:hypothetical protein